MLKKRILILAGLLLLPILISATRGNAWKCDDAVVPFTHKPSDYYGPGEYFAICPQTDVQIRCYHYHRHWVGEKEATFYWDRNLESAARAACDCPNPEGIAPSSPALSKEPKTRFHDVPMQ